MPQGPWLWGIVSVLVVEQLVLLVQPAVVPLLALVPVAERRFTLTVRRRGPAKKAMPTFPRRVALSSSVLFTSGSRIALRRAFGIFNSMWLCSISVQRTGADIQLRARQALSPLLLLPAFLVWWLASLAETGPARESFTFAAFVLAFLAAVLSAQFFQGRADRAASVAEAFDFLEKELRRGLE